MIKYSQLLQFFLLYSISFIICSNINEVNLGVIFPMFSLEQNNNYGPQYLASIIMAINEINNKNDGLYDDILPNTKLKLVVRSSLTQFSTSTISSTSMLSSFNGDGVRVVIGPASTSPLAGSSPIFAEVNTLTVGYCTQSAIFSQPALYPNVLRLNPSVGLQGKLIADIMMGRPDLFMWGRASLITCTDIESRTISSEFKNHIRTKYSRVGLILSETEIISGTTEFKDVLTILRNKKSNIFVLNCPSSVGIPLLLQGYREGVFKEGKQILGAPTIPKNMILGSNKLYDPLEVSNVLKGYITLSLTLDLHRNSLSSSFIQRWRNQKPTNGLIDPVSGKIICDNTTDDDGHFYLYQGINSASPLVGSIDPTLPQYKNQLECAGLNFTNFNSDGSNIARDSFFAYDSTLTVAKGLHHLLYQSNYKDTITSQKQITYNLLLDSIINNIEFDGVTGYIQYLVNKPNGYQGRGDRVTDVLYHVFNFDSEKYLSTINQNSNTLVGDEGMNIIGSVHSENGFTLCSEPLNPFYMIGSCSKMTFNTINNEPPIDHPTATIVQSPVILQVFAVIFVFSGILLSLGSLILLNHLRDSRIIRVSQPGLSYIILVGCISSCFSSILLTIPMSEEICMTSLWFGHFGFILILAPLVVKLLRIELVLGSDLIKRSFTWNQTYGTIFILVFISVTLLIGSFILSPHVTSVMTIKDNQQNHTQEVVCYFGTNVISTTIFLYETLLVLIGLILCYKTRHLPQGLSGCSAAATALFTLIVAVTIILPIVVFNDDIAAPTKYCFLAIIFSIVTIRINSVLFFPTISSVIQGYDYDRKFNLTKVHDGIKLYESLLQLKRKIFKEQVSIQPVLKLDTSDELSERSRIRGEIERLNMRLDLLANRALFQSQMSQRLGEISLAGSRDTDDATVLSYGSHELAQRKGQFFGSLPNIIVEEDEECSIIIKSKPSPVISKDLEQNSHHHHHEINKDKSFNNTHDQHNNNNYNNDNNNIIKNNNSDDNGYNTPTHRSIPSSYFRSPSPQYLLQRPSRIITEENESLPVEQLDDEDFNDEHFDSSITSESPLISSGRRMGWEDTQSNSISIPTPIKPDSTKAKDTSYLSMPTFAKRALPPIVRKSTM